MHIAEIPNPFLRTDDVISPKLPTSLVYMETKNSIPSVINAIPLISLISFSLESKASFDFFLVFDFAILLLYVNIME